MIKVCKCEVIQDLIWRELLIATQTHPPRKGLGTRLLKMHVSEVGAVLGVLVDQLSPVKESRGKADAKYFKGRLSD